MVSVSQEEVPTQEESLLMISLFPISKDQLSAVETMEYVIPERSSGGH